MRCSSATWPNPALDQLQCLQVYTDSDVSTKYHWGRPHVLSPESTATITWDIPEGTLSGMRCQLAAVCMPKFPSLSGVHPVHDAFGLYRAMTSGLQGGLMRC